MTSRPFLRVLVSPAALCALGFVAALAAVMQYSLRAYVPGSLEPGGFTLENFTALMKPLYARVFLDTVWICFLTAFFTLVVGYPLAYALVHARNVALKSTILVITVTPLFLGEVVRTYSWIVVLGNNGFLNSMLLKSGLIEQPLQLMFTKFGVVTALVHVTLPVMVIMLAAALSHIDRDYERAAASLGAGPIRGDVRVDAPAVCHEIFLLGWSVFHPHPAWLQDFDLAVFGRTECLQHRTLNLMREVRTKVLDGGIAFLQGPSEVGR